MCRVLNKHKDPIYLLNRGVYIGRGSKWGNPFKRELGITKEECIINFEAYLLKNTYLMSCLHELKGKDLVCFCSPNPCHGYVLLKYSNK